MRGLVAAMLLLVFSVFPVAAQTPEAGAGVPASFLVEGSPTFPIGEPGIVDVVLVGKPYASYVPIVVRNNTDDTIELDGVLAVARDAEGKLAMIGEYSMTAPFVVAPGEIAIGEASFDDDVPAGLTFEFEIEAGPVGSSSNSRQDIEVQEAVLTVDEVIGILRNPTDTDLGGMTQVVAMCFDEAGGISRFSGGYAAKDELAADETSPFSLPLYGEGSCDSLIVGATSRR